MKTYFVVMTLRGWWNREATLGATFKGRVQAQGPENLFEVAYEKARTALRKVQGSGMGHHSVDAVTIEVYNAEEVAV